MRIPIGPVSGRTTMAGIGHDLEVEQKSDHIPEMVFFHSVCSRLIDKLEAPSS